ncbi:MAG: serpin family protein [Gammaproteobacteria bacterium]|nr:serpin family protein [Gammaproteobacteria bacterium]
MLTDKLSMLGLSALLAVSLAMTACSDDSSTGAADPDRDLTVLRSDLEREANPQVDANDLATQVDANTAFAIDLYKAVLVEQSRANLIASPYSVSIALAMTWAGARGQTETDMAAGLHYELPQASLHPFFNHIDLALESRGEDAEGQDGEPFRLRVANSLWGQKDFTFKQPFLDTLALNYGAGLRVLDFIAEPDDSRLTINHWVEEKTDERIKNLLPEGSITPNTRLVLTNAIYFNAAWAAKFDENSTRDGDFNALDGGAVSVPMMSQMAGFNYTKAGDIDAIELPYDGGEVSMVILLPDDLEAFEARLDTALLTEIDAGLAPAMVDLTMPKFEIESTLPLTRTLQDMGMTSAFINADFTGMADASLAISDVFHKAFIKLDENGTEAAAATAVVVGETSVPVADVTLTIDRPFLYLIRDVETGTVIFIGRVVAP